MKRKMEDAGWVIRLMPLSAKRHGWKGTGMRKYLLGVTLLVLVSVLAASGADDPFTGTWQMERSTAGADANDPVYLILSPAAGGITIQEKPIREPLTLQWGKDSFVEARRMYATIVKVDEHTLTTSYSSAQGGEVSISETGTVSPDGKHYTLLAKYLTLGRELKTEYDRVGPVPTSGDLFWGTWKLIPRDLPIITVTLKVDGDGFEFQSGGLIRKGLTRNLTAKNISAAPELVY